MGQKAGKEPLLLFLSCFCRQGEGSWSHSLRLFCPGA